MFVEFMQEIHMLLMYIVLYVNDITVSSIRTHYNPCYKGSLLWDNLPVTVEGCINLKEFRNINQLYRKYNDNLI